MAFNTSIREDEGIVLLRDEQTGAEAEIFLFGALLNAFRIPVRDGLQNVVEGFHSPADAFANITNGFRSAKLSPFVCRLHKGQYSFEGNDYQVTGHFLNGHAIHGLVFAEKALVLQHHADNEKASVTLEIDYRGKDIGYPFPYHMEITWTLRPENKLEVHTCVVHRNSHVIPYTDGWHPYFTLGETVDDCTLQFNSTTQLEYDEALLPTGNMLTDTRFEKGQILKGVELDNSYRLGSDRRCVLRNNKLQLTIEPDSSYPLLQLYIPPHRKSIAIENLSGPPDNFNNHMDLLLLWPGKQQSYRTSYQVTEV